jgi:Protein of unknown function (DUF4089)
MDARDKPGHDELRDRDMSEPTDPLDAFIDAAAALLAIPIDPAWKPTVKSNLATTLKLAAFVGEWELPDDAEPAPVYTA